MYLNLRTVFGLNDGYFDEITSNMTTSEAATKIIDTCLVTNGREVIGISTIVSGVILSSCIILVYLTNDEFNSSFVSFTFDIF